MSVAQRMHFLQDVFQMFAIALVSVINIIILSFIYFETTCTKLKRKEKMENGKKKKLQKESR